jgi:hypothetical protein
MSIIEHYLSYNSNFVVFRSGFALSCKPLFYSKIPIWQWEFILLEYNSLPNHLKCIIHSRRQSPLKLNILSLNENKPSPTHSPSISLFNDYLKTMALTAVLYNQVSQDVYCWKVYFRIGFRKSAKVTKN